MSVYYLHQLFNNLNYFNNTALIPRILNTAHHYTSLLFTKTIVHKTIVYICTYTGGNYSTYIISSWYVSSTAE